MLSHLLRRVKAVDGVDDIAVATTARPTDDPVAERASREGVRCIRGDEADVLGRFVRAAKETCADVIVRVTGDCPLLDPGETGRVVRELKERAATADYAANVLDRTFPRGLDTEALFRDVLERADRLGRSEKAREHVTWVVNRERPDLFVRHSVRDAENNADLRWTVDAPADLEAVRAIYAGLGLGERILPYREVLAWVRRNPAVSALNSGLAQKDA